MRFSASATWSRIWRTRASAPLTRVSSAPPVPVKPSTSFWTSADSPATAPRPENSAFTARGSVSAASSFASSMTSLPSFASADVAPALPFAGAMPMSRSSSGSVTPVVSGSSSPAIGSVIPRRTAATMPLSAESPNKAPFSASAAVAGLATRFSVVLALTAVTRPL